MKTVFNILKKYSGRLTISFIMLVLSTLCSVALPTIMTNIIDYGVAEQNIDYVYKACLLMGGVSVADLLLVLFAYKIGETTIVKFGGELRAEIFKKANSLTSDSFHKIGQDALLTRSIEDVDRISDVLITLLSALSAIPFTLIAGLILSLKKDVVLSLILLLFTPILLFIVFMVSRKLDPLWRTADEYMDKQNSLIRGRITGIRVVRAFNQENTEQKKVDKATRIWADNMIRANIRGGIIAPVSLLVLNLATVLILLVGAYRIGFHQSSLTAGGILAVIEYVGMIMSGIMTISFTIADIPRAKVNLSRIGMVLNAETEKEESDSLDDTKFSGAIELKNLSYRYPSAMGNAISNINLRIEEGQTVAFIGGTGSGKSTVVKLIAGLIFTSDGELLYGGKKATELSPKQIRKNIACVAQKDAVFSGTIRDNVAAGKEYSDEEIISALKTAQLYDFVSAQKEGIFYPVSQRGGNLSGGQKQRLTIARAALKKAYAYIFDDSFSALDFMTEAKLREELKNKLKGKTQIIITQRATTTLSCDQVFVFDAGRLVGSGKHAELMQNCSVYREIYLSQTATEAEV